MRLYNYNIVLLFSRLLIALLLFTICRVFFYIYNIGLYSDIGITGLIKIFFYGIRFDISVLSYFNALFIVFHIIPWSKLYSKRRFQLALKLYFIVVNIAMVFGNMADSIYFHFTQKRSTADIFKLIFVGDDFNILLPSFIKDYWYIGVITFLLAVLVWKIYPDYKPPLKYSFNKKPARFFQILYKISAMLILAGLLVIGGRGGLQLKPLSIIDASKNVKAAHMPLVLNSVFTVMTTSDKSSLTEINHFKNPEKYYSPVNDFDHNADEFNNKNIVILLLESYSREYVGFLNNYRGYTPFLDSLSNHSLVFTNSFSNGLRSIDAIPAIVCGIPLLMDDPFITSIYSANITHGLAEVLNAKGYQTAFFHGGNNGSMNFDGFAKYAGFQNYYGRDEYGDDNDYDGFWGIYDEPFLQFMIKELNTFKQPFFAFEFTISSHYPYKIPDYRQGFFEEGPMKIHRVVRYTDFAINRFFESAKTTNWYNNTIFIILADHPAQSVIPNNNAVITDNTVLPDSDLLSYYKNTTGRYAIPMMIFAPGDTTLTAVTNKTVQQTDMFPTIMELLKYDKPVFAFGENVLDNSTNGLAVHYVNGLYQITKGNFSLLSDANKPVYLYNNIADPSHKLNLLNEFPEKADSLNTIMKSVLQQYTNRMINNKLLLDN